MENNEIIERTAGYVRAELRNAEGGHDWWHIERVWKNAKTIAAGESVNLLVVELPARPVVAQATQVVHVGTVLRLLQPALQPARAARQATARQVARAAPQARQGVMVRMDQAAAARRQMAHLGMAVQATIRHCFPHSGLVLVVAVVRRARLRRMLQVMGAFSAAAARFPPAPLRPMQVRWRRDRGLRALPSAANWRMREPPQPPRRL